MLKMKLTLATAVALMTTACTTYTDPTSTHAQGWRRAQILVLDKDQLAAQSVEQDCRTAQPASDGEGRFALVSYSYGGNPNLRANRIARMPNELDVSVGDWVFVNVGDCKQALRKKGLLNERP
jgi:hypothetical protein